MGDTGCPSLEQLAAFSGAGLDGARREEVEQHLAQCDECSMVVAAFLDDGRDIDATAGSEELDSAEVRRYRIVRMLGTGGMGTVYEAEEVQADRRVALKLARDAEGAEGKTLLHRFSREARIAALLEHPNIVPVFDIGEFPDGTPYYTQRLIDGQSLASVIAACKLPAERIGLLRHFREMCDAVAYAHGRGIIHRDIKSANVIIGHSGETWVIDWGLARAARVREGEEPALLDEGDALAAVTQAGAALGTPAYMSPEQARGELERVDERSDVWSLGAVLLEILSGKPPFDELRSNEVLRRLRADQGPALDALRAREVPPELAAIAHKALTVRRDQRYPSAIELADDINRWMLGQPVSAYPYNRRQRAWLWLRQHRVLSAAATVAILVGVGWAVSLHDAYARLAGQRADSLFQYASHALTNMQWDRAAVDFASALELDDRRDARLGLALAEAGSPRPLWQRAAEVGVIRAAAFVDQDTVVVAGEDGFAAAFDLQSGAELARRKLAGADPAAVGCAGVAAIAAGNTVLLWRPRGDLPVGSFSLASPVRALAFNPDCTLLALAGRDGVQVRRASGEALASAPGEALAVAFAGPRLVWATRSAALVSSSALELAAPLVLHQDRPLRAISVASGRVLLHFEDGRLAFFELADPARIVPSGGALAVLEHSLLLPDGRSAFGVGKGFGTWFFDADSGVAFCSLAALSRPVFALALTPDGGRFAEGGEDCKLRVYDISKIRTYAGVHPAGSAGARDSTGRSTARCSRPPRTTAQSASGIATARARARRSAAIQLPPKRSASRPTAPCSPRPAAARRGSGRSPAAPRARQSPGRSTRWPGSPTASSCWAATTGSSCAPTAPPAASETAAACSAWPPPATAAAGPRATPPARSRSSRATARCSRATRPRTAIPSSRSPSPPTGARWPAEAATWRCASGTPTRSRRAASCSPMAPGPSTRWPSLLPTPPPPACWSLPMQEAGPTSGSPTRTRRCSGSACRSPPRPPPSPPASRPTAARSRCSTRPTRSASSRSRRLRAAACSA